MTVYLHDGVEFDLDGDFVDVTGVVWSWTGGWTSGEAPILRSDASGPDLSLPDVYHYHGPLLPRRRKSTARPGASFADTVAAGYVESDEAFAARIGGVL